MCHTDAVARISGDVAYCDDGSILGAIRPDNRQSPVTGPAHLRHVVLSVHARTTTAQLMTYTVQYAQQVRARTIRNFNESTKCFIWSTILYVSSVLYRFC